MGSGGGAMVVTGSGGTVLEVEGACKLVRPTDTSGDKLLMRN